MHYNLQYVPVVNAAAGVLSSCFANRDRIIAVDHITVATVNPECWDLIFVLCAETTFKIRSHLDRLGSRLVLIHTSDEPGLEKYNRFFFPHWLFCVSEVNDSNKVHDRYIRPSYSYNALMGRAKDSRTQLLMQLDNRNLLEHGIIGYRPGNYYTPPVKINPTAYYNGIWKFEERELRELYSHEINYLTGFDSTTRLTTGHFSSCLIPWEVYDNSSVTVVCETDNHGSHSFVTEKTWKPLLARHPVIFYATRQHENFLERLGFEIYVKTSGDPTIVADILEDFTKTKSKYDYYQWGEKFSHNRDLCCIISWRKRFHQWLHENFVN